MPNLEDLYREVILDHFKNPRNQGVLETPPAHKSEGFNPMCGDEITVYVDVKNGVIEDIKIDGSGCSISQSSASMMSAAIKGKSLEEATNLENSFKEMMSIHEAEIGKKDTEQGSQSAVGKPEVKLGDLEALKGVVKYPVRIKCAVLSWNTLNQALEEQST